MARSVSRMVQNDPAEAKLSALAVSGEELRRLLHDLKQPLNIIRLANGNVRHRVVPTLADEDAAYLSAKLDRIEEQVQRAADLVEQIMNGDAAAG